MNIFEFPDCVFEVILSYLSYDDIAKSRIVCKKFNEINMMLLNHGFLKLVNCHGKQMKKIKAQLPRRESERRNHPLSKHSDILTCIETRLSMLNMTYLKYIERRTVCFIPGKVIDECFKILRSTSLNENSQMRTHEILQELRDLSSMAIEHFEEKIVPDIQKAQIDQKNVSISTIYEYLASSPRPGDRPSIESLSFDLSRNSSSSSVSTNMDCDNHQRVKTRKKLSSVIRLYKKQSKIIKEQGKQINKAINSLKHFKRRLDESEMKNREMTENIRQLKFSATPMQGLVEPVMMKKRTATMVLRQRLDQP